MDPSRRERFLFDPESWGLPSDGEPDMEEDDPFDDADLTEGEQSASRSEEDLANALSRIPDPEHDPFLIGDQIDLPDDKSKAP